MYLRKRDKKIRIIEFLVMGLMFGIAEDLLAIKLTTNATIDFNMVWIVLAIALPFAFVSEIVVDNPRFWEKIFPKKDEGSGGGTPTIAAKTPTPASKNTTPLKSPR